MKLITLVQVSDAEEEDERNIAKLLTVSGRVLSPLSVSLRFPPLVHPQTHSSKMTPANEPAILCADLICHFPDPQLHGRWRLASRAGCHPAIIHTSHLP